MTLVVKFHWIWSELLYIIFASYSITLALPIRHGSSRCHSVENAWAIFSNFYVCLWILTILIKAINRKVWDYWGTRPCSTMCIGTHLKCEKIQLNSRYTYINISEVHFFLGKISYNVALFSRLIVGWIANALNYWNIKNCIPLNLLF